VAQAEDVNEAVPATAAMIETVARVLDQMPPY
jgi:hypothetical protein